LTLQQLLVEEGAGSPGEPLRNQHLRSFQIRHLYLRGVDDQQIAVALFKRRARDHRATIVKKASLHKVSHGVQRRPSVFDAERDAAAHLSCVLRRMEIVRIVELASQARGQDTPDRGLSRSCHSNQDYDLRSSPQLHRRATAQIPNRFTALNSGSRKCLVRFILAH
jgi:hypothetical protein